MRRLKIDEKLNSIGTAVKNAANEGQVVARQISSTGSVSQLKSSEQRQKPTIKMDGRETFSSHSDLPVRVKSIKAGGPLIIHSDDYIYEKSQSLSKIPGTWVIDVQVHKAELRDSALSERFKLTSTEIKNDTVDVVFRSLSELLRFYTSISEQLSSYIDCAEQITYQNTTNGNSYSDKSFHKLDSLERLKMCGSMLEDILNANMSGNDHAAIWESHGKTPCCIVYCAPPIHFLT